MERLTDKIITKACNDPWDLCELDSVCKRDCYKPTPCKIPHVVYRLAQIEDILGDTYDLDRLRELVAADKDGRCVLLPVKPNLKPGGVKKAGVLFSLITENLLMIMFTMCLLARTTIAK